MFSISFAIVVSLPVLDINQWTLVLEKGAAQVSTELDQELSRREYNSSEQSYK